MLQTYDVPPIVGRVRYLTQGQSSFNMTVECPGRKIAFTAAVGGTANVKVGEWVELVGRVRLNPGISKSGELYEKNLQYRHDPFDGSPWTEWIFFEMNSFGFRSVPPPEVDEALASLGRHARTIHAKFRNSTSAQFLKVEMDDMIEAFNVVRRHYSSALREMEPVKSIDLADVIPS